VEIKSAWSSFHTSHYGVVKQFLIIVCNAIYIYIYIISPFKSMYPSLSLPTIPVFLNFPLFCLNVFFQELCLVSLRGVTKFMFREWSVDNAPEKESQCSFTLFLPTFQTFRAEWNFSSARYKTTYFIVAIMCKLEHGRPVLPFVPSANTCYCLMWL
jgi:hypothetical protein